ncbi:hypothetical protein LINGRAPRIM_LOCUS625 [Linum grandiflorum]
MYGSLAIRPNLNAISPWEHCGQMLRYTLSLYFQSSILAS